MDAHSFTYVECDVPDGMTLREWRRREALGAARPPRLAGLRRLFRLPAVAA
jgi:hypothetical protein